MNNQVEHAPDHCIHCSFCFKCQHDIEGVLVAGMAANICDECIAMVTAELVNRKAAETTK